MLSGSVDKREAIAQRMLVLLGDIPELKTQARNVIQFDDTQLPAASLLEGDEEVEETPVMLTRGSRQPLIVSATFQIFLRHMDRDTVGTDLNQLRMLVIGKLQSDTTLASLTANGRGVRYSGMQSTLHAARSMMGAFAMTFVAPYELRIPADAGRPC